MNNNTPVVDFNLDVEQIRKEFPILNQEINGKPLVYLDNAATTQKPQIVIDALVEYYQKYNANIHRGIHTLAEKATAAYEATREATRAFINADSVEQVIFTKGTTESVNLVASSYGSKFINEGDEVLVSGMEHHSNIVPWQLICERKKAHLKVIPVDENGVLDLEGFSNILSEKTKIVSIVFASNTLGTINPVKEIIAKAHDAGAVVMIDGAQATAHLQFDVKDLDVDFLGFSAHKMYGPNGVGVLYGKRELLEEMPPYMGGGEMIKDVSFSKTTYNDLPFKFEAGTPNIADVVAFKQAIEFINIIGKDKIQRHELELLNYGHEKIGNIEGIRLIGTAANKVSVISFVVKGVHHFDLGMMLDAKGIAVRTGHHCTQPLMDQYKIEGTVRASFAVYNTIQEIDTLVDGLERIVKIMK
jgi:cysteine desulfurase / selenocysteine lyase